MVEQRKRYEVMSVHTREKEWTDRKIPQGQRTLPLRDIIFEKQVLHQDIFMSLWQQKGFSTQRIGLLRTNPARRVSVIDETMSEVSSSFAANTGVGLK